MRVPSVTALEQPTSVTPTDPILAAALDYIARGWYVLPCRVGTKTNARGEQVKDVRLPKNWGGISTRDPQTVQEWYQPGGKWHGGSVAVDTGKSGLVVVDLDTSGEKNGFASWQDIGGGVASYVNGTPSGGAHLFFRADPARPVGTDAHGKLGHGIDVRAVGGLVIMPPSIDWRGNPYRETAAADWRNLTPVPDIVVERVPLGGHGAPSPSVPGSPAQRDPSGLTRFVAPGDGVPKYTKADADARMRTVLGRAIGTPEGSGFNHALNEAAFEVGHWVGGGYIPRYEAESMLSYVVTQVFPHGPNGDDLATIESGLRGGEAKPYAVLPDLPDLTAGLVSGVDPAADDAFEQEIGKQYWRLKATEMARERLAAEKVVGDSDGKVDWDVLDQPPKQVAWQVPDLIAAGRSYSIVGGPKSGKSTTARHLAVRAAEAGIRVLYLDRENTWEGDWVPQLQGMGVGKSISQFLDVRCFPAIPPLDTEAGGLALLEWVQESGVRIVAIDMLLRFLAGKENDSDTFNAFDRHTGQKLKAIGVTVIRLDHTGKAEGAGARGSSAKSGDVDVQWMLTRQGSQVTLDPNGITRKADQRGAVTLMVRDGRLQPVDDSHEVLTTEVPEEGLQRHLGMLLDQGTITLKSAGVTVLRLLQERGQAPRKAEFYVQWKLFLAARGDGVAADVTQDRPRFSPTFMTPAVPDAVPSDLEKDETPGGSVPETVPEDDLGNRATRENTERFPVPGTGSQDRGTAGTGTDERPADQQKQRFPRSRNRGNR